MKTALVTGAGGLVGSEAVRRLIEEGFSVYGIDNDMRRYFFGEEASTEPMLRSLAQDPAYREDFIPLTADIRDTDKMEQIVDGLSPGLDLLLHTAAQPSHDWAAREPHTDFDVNARGTLNLLQAVRKFSPDTTFAHISTSKVYGDTPNRLPLLTRKVAPHDMRYDLSDFHAYYEGIDTTMSIDNCLHSLFGVSKVAGDLLVQEYSRYFDIPAICLRPGCVTGPAHAGAELHGFLSYLVKCAVTGKPYTVYGYEGLQVRCNIYAADLVDCCLEFHRDPKIGAIYNIGGGRPSACSMLEAIHMAEKITGRPFNFTISEEARIGDHKWWISDIAAFQADYPNWKPSRTVKQIIEEIHEANAEKWAPEAVAA